MKRVFVPTLFSVFVAGCASLPPDVSLLPGADIVVLVSDPENALPDGCIELKYVSVSDGGMGAKHYDGTWDRGLLRLRNAAVKLGANYVRIDLSNSIESIGFDGTKGREIWIRGTAYKCN